MLSRDIDHVTIQTYNTLQRIIITHVFLCDFCKISKNTFLTEHLQAIAFLLYTTKLRKDLFPMKIKICGMGTSFKNISRYVHFQENWPE